MQELEALQPSSSTSLYDGAGSENPREAQESTETTFELRYVITFETIGFTPEPRQNHVHFYYNTVAADHSGLPGDGPWEIHVNADPFTRFRLADRPADATEICIIGASGDHHFIEGTGMCMPIPDDASE